MKGVSVFIAITVIADIIHVNQFRNSKAFTSYLRSAPCAFNSNTSRSVLGTNKKGRKLSASLLTQSMRHVLFVSPKLNHWYIELTKYKKPGLVRTGLRRKLFAEMFQMLKNGEYHYVREKQKHEAKMSQYRTFLKKEKFFWKSFLYYFIFKNKLILPFFIYCNLLSFFFVYNLHIIANKKTALDKSINEIELGYFYYLF